MLPFQFNCNFPYNYHTTIATIVVYQNNEQRPFYYYFALAICNDSLLKQNEIFIFFEYLTFYLLFSFWMGNNHLTFLSSYYIHRTMSRMKSKVLYIRDSNSFVNFDMFNKTNKKLILKKVLLNSNPYTQLIEHLLNSLQNQISV